MRIQIDRDLPVPVSTQLRGQIEYGVTNGDFPDGSRLPSVRELAEQLGVSPVTVSQVYKSLSDLDIIETVPGRGTFVRLGDAGPDDTEFSRLDRLLAEAMRIAEREGISRASFLERVQRQVTRGRDDTPLRIVLLGVYPKVTASYAADLRRHLRTADHLRHTTFDEVNRGSQGNTEQLAGADLVLTFAHRRADLVSLAPAEAEIATLNLIPSERTRIALAEVDPLARVVLVSTIPEFVATFRRAVGRFASHVESVKAVLWGGPEAAREVAGADVVVYGTGSEVVLDGMPGHIRAFEYRHVPDPVHMEHVLLPFIARLRARRSASANTALEAV